MASQMTAEQIGAAARRDLQIVVPTKPSVRRGVRLRADGDAILVDGSPRPQVFRGSFAKYDLLRLVDACDGRHNIASLASDLDLEESVVYKAVALLWTAGIVEEASEASAGALSEEYKCYLSRLGDSTGANISWQQAAGRFDSVALRLSGDRALSSAVKRLVGGLIEIVDGGHAHSSGKRVITIFFDTEASADELSAVHSEIWSTGAPLLRVFADSRTMVVGPYVDKTFTPCLECGCIGDSPRSGDVRAETYDLIAGTVVRELFALVTRAVNTHLPADSCVLDLSSLTSEFRPSTTRPGCSRCSYGVGSVASAPPLSAVFEATVALPPRQFADQKGHQAHYRSSNLKLQYEFRQWPSCPRTKLPAPEMGLLALREPGKGPATDRRQPTMVDIANILTIACGLKEQPDPTKKLRRWTAAGGNLGSVTAYIVIRDPHLMEMGTYAYLEEAHALARIGSDVPPGSSPVSLVFSGRIGKVAQKYGAFSLRVILQDGGCAVTSAREVAHASGVGFTINVNWNDLELHRACGTLPDSEPITAVISLGEVDAH